ncbi:hypothetical protein FHR33_002785 [Nonomuraea dietziae]|uniref:Uncharacterized protein n=1 Tax=Nonomuraea dietziae TaxID=65515 RepID=A0A7W5V8N2_9ACTN|nr:hypothetical protein [Nonomuraea dietziae]
MATLYVDVHMRVTWAARQEFASVQLELLLPK